MMERTALVLVAMAALLPWGLAAARAGAAAGDAMAGIRAGRFRWTVGPPLIAALDRPGDPIHAVKDASVVRFDGRWHVFCSIRGTKRSHRIEYVSFADWQSTAAAERHVLELTEGYFCAPQVFYFRPQGKWYMILQVVDESREPALQPAFSTTGDIADPVSWTPPRLLYAEHPANVEMWIDFWVICDEELAHLFFTSLDGRMWRAKTPLDEFPSGWGRPEVALRGDVFEASHTYRLRGQEGYLTIVEAQAGGRRYYKAYLADRLDGEWRPVAAERGRPFAGPVNVTETAGHWTDSFSHGELLRAGCDERLEVEPDKLRLLFQGATDEQMAGRAYGDIPWRLGLLEPAP
jgi:hypothetical protein